MKAPFREQIKAAIKDEMEEFSAHSAPTTRRGV